MQKKIGLIILCLSVAVAFDCLWAGTNPVRAEEYRFKIDFGKARPIERIVVDRNLSIKTDPGENWVKVNFDSNLANHKGDHIPINRLNVAINDRNFELDRGPFEVDSKNLSNNDKLFLSFSLNLTPADRPGNYQGKITFETQLKKVTFQLEVEVEPWVRIEADQSLIRMDQTMKEDFKLQSSIPLHVRVASNTDWVLSANLANDSKVPIQIKLDQELAREGIRSLFPMGERLETEKKALFNGNATVSPSDSYWAEMSMAVYIGNFTKYPAGEQLFQIRFLLELWDQKTVNL